MQAHFTQFGRIEADPMRIPLVGEGRKRDDAFARELTSAVERDAKAGATTRVVKTDANAGAEVVGEQVDGPPALTPPAPEPEPTPARPREDAASTPALDAAGAVAAPARAVPADAKAAAPVAAPGHDDTGLGPSRTSQPANPVPGWVPGSVPGTRTGGGPPALLGAVPAAALAGATSARAAAGGTAAPEAAGLRRPTLSTPATGYRSLDRLALDRLEAARDSVLRQITFTLAKGTSEARVQLEPPELGGLDMRVVVDAAGQTRLSLVAERPEIAALLTQHMPALASALAQQGLTIAHADVRSRDGKPRGELFGDTPARPAPSVSTSDSAGARASRRTPSFITATGLDFWA